MTQKDKDGDCSLPVIPEDSGEWLPESPKTRGTKVPGHRRFSLPDNPSYRSTFLTPTCSANVTPHSALEVDWEVLKSSEYVHKNHCSCTCGLF